MSVHSTDAPHIRTRSKPNRDKHSSSYSSKFSSKGKTYYDDELEDIDKLKFTDEGLGNLREGHIVEDVEEEVTGLFYLSFKFFKLNYISVYL